MPGTVAWKVNTMDSLPKLLAVSIIKLFQKDIINFLVVRRHDLGYEEEQFRYLAVKPSDSIWNLRQKIWHLLELPDHCDEIITLMTDDKLEVPLTQLRKGNQPHNPYYLEVWLPPKRNSVVESKTTVIASKMIMMGAEPPSSVIPEVSTTDRLGDKQDFITSSLENGKNESRTTITTETVAFNKMNMKLKNFVPVDHKKPCCRLSNCSLFGKTHKKPNMDNFATILLKIQSDLNTLSNKLSNLELKIPM